MTRPPHGSHASEAMSSAFKSKSARFKVPEPKTPGPGHYKYETAKLKNLSSGGTCVVFPKAFVKEGPGTPRVHKVTGVLASGGGGTPSRRRSTYRGRTRGARSASRGSSTGGVSKVCAYVFAAAHFRARGRDLFCWFDHSECWRLFEWMPNVSALWVSAVLALRSNLAL